MAIDDIVSLSPEELQRVADRVLIKRRKGLYRIPVRSSDLDLPLSYPQERIWLLDQVFSLGSAYNESVAFRLDGSLDTVALAASFAALVDRHEILRTRFEIGSGAVLQVIEAAAELSLTVTDVRPGGEAEAQRLVHAEVLRRFDLARGPLFRGLLVRMSERQSILVVTVHHIVWDGWSASILIRELGELYAAQVQGRSPALPALPVQYADYALWQCGWLQGEVLERQLAYWRGQLAGAPEALDLPTDHPRPAEPSFQGGHAAVTLSRALSETLGELARQHGATLYMVLLAGFQALLGHWSGQRDVVVGSPIAGRTQRQTEGLIGFFVNTLVLRADLSGDPSFLDLLEQVRETALGAYAHQDIPFEKLVADLQPERDLSRQPLFQVMFALQNVPQEPLTLPGLRLEPQERAQGTAKFDLFLQMTEREGELAASFEYATDLFEAETIERLAERFERLLAGVAADPQRPVSELELLGADERAQLVTEWNATRSAYPRAGVHELFAAQAARCPEAVAVVSGDTSLSYRALEERANRLGHHLQALGVGPEVVVGLCVERTADLVVGLLGILKAGGAYLPLDPAYPAERLGYMLSDARVAVVVTQASLEGLAAGPGRQQVVLDRDAAAIAARPSTAPRSGTGPDNLAYVIYTSGSTGTPKGVMVAHGSVANFLLAMAKCPGVNASDVLVAVTPISFDIAGLELFLPLTVGGRICLVDREVTQDGERLRRAIDDTGATVMQGTPSTWRMLLEAGWTAGGMKVLCGGEALPVDLGQAFASAEAWNLYGPTETTIWSTLQRLVPGQAIRIGRPIKNTQAYVMDARLELVPEGVVGELCIAGDGLARGYMGKASLSAVHFVPNPFAPGERMYRTGDLARWRRGELEFVGRRDNQVKLRGYRIELGEIEAALLAHGQVRSTVATVREDVPGDKRLVAYAVLAEDASTSPAELKTYLNSRLPGYMVPSVVVALAELPLTPNGKIDRRALPVPEIWLDAAAHVPPSTPTQGMLAQIWRDVLNIDQVGVHDNFFTLGGHSLLAAQVIVRLRDKFRVDLPLRAMFEAPTIAKLARRVAAVAHELARSSRAHGKAEAGRVAPVPIVIIQPGSGTTIPLFCIHPVGGSVHCYGDLARALGTDHTVFGVEAPGLDGSRSPMPTATEMAEHYLRHLTAMHSGPYALAGWSLGGLIAFDLASRLRQAGRGVAVLALFDSSFPTDPPNGIDKSDRVHWISFIRNFERPDLHALIDADHRFWTLARMDRLAVIRKHVDPADDTCIDGSWIDRSYTVFEANRQAWRDYQPQVFDGRVTLFFAGASPARATFDRYRSRRGNMFDYVIHEVAADHYSIVRPPAVQSIARVIRSGI